MQMFLWTPPGGSPGDRLDILNGALTGQYGVVGAAFGADLSSTIPLTAELVVVFDVGTDPYDACELILNPGEIAGKIAVIVVVVANLAPRYWLLKMQVQSLLS
jgi:hypothetical protein